MWRFALIAVLLMSAARSAAPPAATPHGPVDIETLFAQRTPFQDALHTVERVQADLDGIQYRLGLAYLGACLGQGTEVSLRVSGAAEILEGFDRRHAAAIGRVWALADGHPDVPPIQDLADWLSVLLMDAERLRVDMPQWEAAAASLSTVPIMEWKSLFDALLEEPPMALPDAGYDLLTIPNPTGDVTDFPFYVDLSQMSSDWWAAIDTTDWTKGRAAIDASATELASSWLDLDTVAKTGGVWVGWSGVIGSTGTHNLRVYPPQAANASYAAGDPYGSQAVWKDYECLLHLNENPAGSAPQYGDATGNGHAGTATGSISRVVSPVGYGAQCGSASGGNFIEVPNDSALAALDDFSIDAILKIDTWPTTSRIPYMLSLYSTIDNQRCWGFQLRGPTSTNGDSCTVWLSTSGTAATSFPDIPYLSKSYLDDGEWHHVAIKRSGSTAYLLIDGVQRASVSLTGTLYNSSVAMRLFQREGHSDSTAARFGMMSVRRSYVSAEWTAYESANRLDNATFWGTPTWVPPAGGVVPIYMYYQRMRAH